MKPASNKWRVVGLSASSDPGVKAIVVAGSATITSALCSRRAALGAR